MRYIFTFFLFLGTLCASAQFVFKYDQSISVKVGEKTLAMPWAGGMNAVQYNTIDLNGDGVEDLVLFDRTSNKISTYLAQDNSYVYAPDYEAYFPQEITNWILLRDYDCDGKKDIFTYDPFGMTLYRNVSSGTALAWEVSIDPVTTLGTGSIINLKVNGSDIPAIEDIDGDGDLDILIFGFNGGGLQYHQNFSMERTGTCDKLDLERITTSWGDFTECGCGVFVFGADSCPEGGRLLHVGGKSLLAYDMDGDGDMEIVIGEEGCDTLYLLENKGDATNPVMDSFVAFPNTTNPASFASFPAAFLEDINFDGKKDLLVSPNLSANSLFAPTDFQHSSWVYDNTGSSDVPSFQFASTSFLQEQMLDHGNNASVAFADEDGDGDMDMLVTSHGQFSQFSGYQSQIALYRNIGTKAVPAYELENEDYLGFSAFELGDMKLQFADMNGDGNQDLVIAGTFVSTHTVFYLLNTSSSGLNFTDQQAQFLNVQLLSFDNPYFFDVDQDGLMDLLLGKSNGNLFYYNNVGTGELPDFQLETEIFYGLGISFTNRNLIPTVGDLDGDGDMDLVTTDGAGQLTIYDDFLRHLDAPLEGLSEVYFNPLTGATDVFRLGVRVRPTIVDLQNSSTPLIVLGTVQGGLQILKNTEALPPRFGEEDDLLSVFPNPGAVGLNNGIIEISTKEALSIRIVTVLGKEVYPSFPITPTESFQLSVESLPSGMYIVIAARDGKILDQAKFIIAD